MAGVVKGSRVCRGMWLWFRLEGRIKWLVAALGLTIMETELLWL